MNPILKKGADIHHAKAKNPRRRSSLLGLYFDRTHSQRLSQGDVAEENDTHEGNNNSEGATSSSSLPAVRQLTLSDLYQVPPSMRASALQPIFDEYFEQEKGKVVKTLWRLASPTFLPAGLCQLITVFAQVAVPLFVWKLLSILEENPSKNVFGQAVPYVFLILVADVFNAYGTNRQRFLAMKSGVTIRVAIIGAIYERVLELTPKGKIGLTTGAVTNLFAIDTQKLFEVTAEGHLLWSAPLSMLLVAIMLIFVVGPSMAVGIVLLLLFAPIVQMISNKMMEIRKQRVKVTDRRVEIVNAMLQGIKVTKLNNYESRYIERIQQVRDEELGLLRRELYVWSMVMAVQFISPVVASAGAFAAYVLAGNILTTADAFTALLLFNALRFPINYASRLIGKVAQARESARRISIFMKREVRDNRMKMETDNGTKETNSASTQSPLLENIEENANGVEGSISSEGDDVMTSLQSNKELLVIKNGTFRAGDNISHKSWDDINCGADDDGFTVGGINMSVGPGEILAIVGPVGSGKSTIINAIIGEVSVSPETTIQTHGKVAYASQVAFILNATLRDNILFGNPFDVVRYNQVLHSCCLLSDIEQLSAGDMTEIGERGVTLSGGQKQRVSIARVVYSNPDVALFDDPLSALDAGTSRKVFDRLFKQSKNTLLSKTAVVLVTHASHFLHRVDQVMVVVDGTVPFSGTWDELCSAEVDDAKAKVALESIRNAVQEDGGNESFEDKFNHSVLTNTEVDRFKEAMLSSSVHETLMQQEAREHGITRTWAWTLWFREAGGAFFSFGIGTLFALEKLFYFGTEWWMTRWTKAIDEPINFLGIEFPPQSDGLHAQYLYLAVYAIFLVIGFVCAFLRTIWIVSGGIKCSKQLYSTMTACVLHAPMVYFETTPMGRLLNRFTYDAEILDVTLVWSMSMLLIASSWFLTALIVMVVILPWMLIVMLPITVCYWMIQLHYRKSGADLQRLDAVSRSPLQAMLAEGIEGSATIRTFNKETTFAHRFHGSADKNTSAQLNFISAQRWLGIRIELLGVTIVFVATLLVIIFNEVFGLSAGLVALLIRWSSGLTVSLSFLVDNAAEAEGAITAIERIKKMADTPQEPNFEKKKNPAVDSAWPTKGELTFSNVNMRYRPRLPLALDGLSFHVKAGQHCGVVGRTGAGKSSLSVALFRLVEIEGGTISVDDVDLSTLGLSDVRGRPNGIAIIPQDPFLFAGSLRECLDPFGVCSDEKLLEALLSVRMLNGGKGKEHLDSRVEEGGANYSVGERSLLVLARAMLARPKLLLMDEATGEYRHIGSFFS